MKRKTVSDLSMRPHGIVTIFIIRSKVRPLIEGNTLGTCLGLKPAFQASYDASVHTPTAQSVIDALYRGDAEGAKKIFTDYINSTKDFS